MNDVNIGICGWCVDRTDVLRGIEVAGDALGVSNIQIGLFGASAINAANAREILQASQSASVKICGVFVGFDGEDYTSIERIARTGGLAPEDTLADRLAMIRGAAELTASLGCKNLTIHACTVATDVTSPLFAALVERVTQAATLCDDVGVRLLLETGREPVDTLLALVSRVDSTHVGIAFDPANLVIYGTDDPVAAAKKLRGSIECVHLKDAVLSAVPGVEFGSAAPLGAGDAQVARIVSRLRSSKYDGPLLIERSGVDPDGTELRIAVDYIRSMIA